MGQFINELRSFFVPRVVIGFFLNHSNHSNHSKKECKKWQQ